MNDKEVIKAAVNGYPTKFYDYSDGAHIAKEIINKWIEEAILGAKKKIVNNGLDEAHCFISSGNTLIAVEVYKQKNGKFTVFINVTNNYKNMSFSDIEFLTE